METMIALSTNVIIMSNIIMGYGLHGKEFNLFYFPDQPAFAEVSEGIIFFISRFRIHTFKFLTVIRHAFHQDAENTIVCLFPGYKA